jgi:ABC-type Mn2+/Zn2+ transport system ATPase subunit
MVVGVSWVGVHLRAVATVGEERVGLADFGPRSVTELSGGEAKRVALARHAHNTSG